MNTSNLKKYAPQARRDFKEAVSRRLNALGISVDSKGQIVTIEPHISGSIIQIGNNNFDAKINGARNRLINTCNKSGFDAFVEHVAYTWFNRLCAIRYMELHDYLDHGFRVLSHPNNPTSFELLDHAQDVAEALGLDRSQLIELKLAGNKDEELYRELLLGQCHALHVAMPFLFEALDDEAELLLPDNLTRTDSLIRGLIDEVPEEDWEQVEVIGWLYQFYISEKKDQVIGKVVKSEDIPAATQLFTPNWIVKYLVQNSVGRHWLQTYPDSGIKGQMEYYIEPAEQTPDVIEQLKAITPESIEPESIKVLDPACGSGHILIEAYNVLKAIYEERGYRSRDIPKLILENNLFGLDIDDRAAQLAGFALTMMARNDDKRIFTRNVRLHVLSLQESNDIDLPALWRALNLSGSWQQGNMPDLFANERQDLSSFNADNRYQLLKRTLERFTQAKTFGSLIAVPEEEYKELTELLFTLSELENTGDAMQKSASRNLMTFIHQALVLAQKYDSVIANPPYMGKGMNNDLKLFAQKNFPNSKFDLFSIFMEHSFNLIKLNGFNAQINMQSWMFLSSYERLREWLLNNKSIITLAHLGAKAFSQISGEVVQTTAWVIQNKYTENNNPVFFRLVDGNEELKKRTLLNRENNHSQLKQSDFFNIPGTPISYWISEPILNLFIKNKKLDNIEYSDGPCKSGNDSLYLRFLWEINFNDIGINSKWRPCAKGGIYRKYYGNIEHVLKWQTSDQLHYREDKIARITSEQSRDLEGITWSIISSSSGQAFRYLTQDSLFNSVSPSIFQKTDVKYNVLAYLNTSVADYLLSLINPTLATNVGNILSLPFPKTSLYEDELVSLAKDDWDEYETSLNFSIFPLLSEPAYPKLISKNYSEWLSKSQASIRRYIELEEQNNRFVIDEFSLSEFVTHKVRLDKVSLNCNPNYLFGNSDDASLLMNQRSFQLSNLVSYSIGCMMGRYSLDRKGLVYAHSGNNGFSDLVTDGAYATYPADEDGIIPLTDQEWFKDDATNRFREFVKVVWGEEHLQENLDFVAESLCLNAIKPKKSEPAMETIRRYLSTQLYKDHLKTYKKRPIYWLFSSGKQKAFECLVYLHRYNEGTLSRMRTEYVTPLLGKYDAYIDQLKQQVENADSTAEANRLKKEQDALIKKQVELREFDDKLKHYADMRISLDLDDGVKVNYGKFGDLLSDVKAITGSDSGVE